jgi:hypothetical protein
VKVKTFVIEWQIGINNYKYTKTKWTILPSNLLSGSPPPSPPPLPCVTDSVWLGGGGGVEFCWRPYSAEAEFLDVIGTKVSWILLLAIHSHLYSFALRFLSL